MSTNSGDSKQQFVAGWNMAGYLPETDPEVFDTIEDAALYLQETVDRFADEDEAEPIVLDRGADYVDGWYNDLHFWAEPYTED